MLYIDYDAMLFPRFATILLPLCVWSLLMSYCFWLHVSVESPPAQGQNISAGLVLPLLIREGEAYDAAVSVSDIEPVRTRSAELAQKVQGENSESKVSETVDAGTYINESRSARPVEGVEQRASLLSRHRFDETNQTASTAHRQRKRYKMVVGILSALRKPPTVLGLAERLVHETNTSDYKLLFLQSYSAAYQVETKLALESLGYTVFTMASEYAELEPSRLQITWGDPPSRVKWRTNHGENIIRDVWA